MLVLLTYSLYLPTLDDKNITGFIVEVDLENGITLGDEENKLGIKASSTRQVFFNETKVPVENMLAGRGESLKLPWCQCGTYKISCSLFGRTAACHFFSRSVSNERVQFKTPIAKFGAIQSKLATMATNCFTADKLLIVQLMILNNGLMNC